MQAPTKAKLIQMLAAYYAQESADLTEEEFEGEGYGCCEDINAWFNDQLISDVSRVAIDAREASIQEAKLESQL